MTQTLGNAEFRVDLLDILFFCLAPALFPEFLDGVQLAGWTGYLVHDFDDGRNTLAAYLTFSWHVTVICVH